MSFDEHRAWEYDWEWDPDEFIDHLQLIPERFSLGVFTDIGLALGPINSPLPFEIWKELEELISQWEPYYMMENAELEKSKGAWLPLELKGIELAKRIRKLTGIPISYSSPGFRTHTLILE